MLRSERNPAVYRTNSLLQITAGNRRPVTDSHPRDERPPARARGKRSKTSRVKTTTCASPPPFEVVEPRHADSPTDGRVSPPGLLTMVSRTRLWKSCSLTDTSSVSIVRHQSRVLPGCGALLRCDKTGHLVADGGWGGRRVSVCAAACRR